MIAAVVYGAGDFLGGLASRKTPTFGVVLWSQTTGLAVLAAVLPFVPGHATAADIGWGCLAGIVGAAAVGLLYRALAIGTMGVVSPLTAVLAALLPVGFGTLRSGAPPMLVVIGIAFSLVAVVAVSAAPSSAGATARNGIAEALSAGLLFGAFFILLAQTHAAAGLYPLAGARVASIAAFALAGAILRVPFRPAGVTLRIIAAGGACDMLANVFYVIAAHEGSLAIVATITALYPASTVALAAFVLHERLRAIQWAGVGFALGGVAFITAGH